jgi:hypothetical protein
MEMLDMQYVSNETADSVNALIQFKEKVKNLYELEEAATNEFDKQIFKFMNENFRKHEIMITKLVRSGHVKFK